MRQRTSLVVWSLGLLVAASSSEAWAQSSSTPTVVFTRFRGRESKPAEAQLYKILCARIRCLAPRKSAARRDDADTLVFGRVLRVKGGRWALKLSIMSPDLSPLQIQQFALDRKLRLRKGDVRAAMHAVLKTSEAQRRELDEDGGEAEDVAGEEEEETTDLGADALAAGALERSAPEPPAVADSMQGERSRAARRELEPSSEHDPWAADEKTSASAAQREVSSKVEGSRRKSIDNSRDDSWLVIQIDGQVTARELRYQGPSSGDAQLPSSDRIVAPMVHLRVFPPGLGGLGLEGRVLQTFGRSASVRDVKGASLSVAMQQVLLSWRLGSSGSFELRPQLGVRRHAVALQRSEGFGFVDAPGVDYRGWTAGIDMSWAMFRSLRLEGRVAYLGIVSSGEIISESYFASGRTQGADASMGLGLSLFGATELVATANLSLYQHRFDTEPGQLYVASGGIDRFLSGAVGVRTAF